MEPVCMNCEHYLKHPQAKGDAVAVFCAAFPDGEGIPPAILDGENGHRRPVAGDNGLRFKLWIPPPPVDK
jgi:hypothetical protein